MLQDILSLLYEYDKRLAKGGGGGMNRASYLLYKCGEIDPGNQIN